MCTRISATCLRDTNATHWRIRHHTRRPFNWRVMPLFYFYLFICLFHLFFLFPLSLLEWRLYRATNLGWNDGIHETFPVWRLGSGNSSIIQRDFIKLCVTFSLPYLAFIADCEGKQLELGLITKTGTGGREGKDGNHAALRGGLVLYK